TTSDDDGKPVQQSEWTYEVGDLTPVDGSGRHTDFRVVRFQVGHEPAYHIVSVRVNGALLQYAGWAPLFGESRATAPVIHFGGPAVPLALRGGTIHRGKRHPDVHFCIGTPGLGPNSFAYISYEAIPPTLNPIVEIAWP